MAAKKRKRLTAAELGQQTPEQFAAYLIEKLEWAFHDEVSETDLQRVKSGLAGFMRAYSQAQRRKGMEEGELSLLKNIEQLPELISAADKAHSELTACWNAVRNAIRGKKQG